MAELPDLEDLVAEFEAWEDETSDAQQASIRDRQYYDGEQLSDADLAALAERGQPPIVINRIARKINFILGEEVRKRIDPIARPVTPQHEDDSRVATDALRHIDEVSGFDELCGLVFADVAIEGCGAAMVCADEQDAQKVSLKHVPWDRFYYDPKSRKPDFSDALYMGHVLWLDIEDAVAQFPDHADELEGALTSGWSPHETTGDRPHEWSDSRRKRVKICEHYRRIGLDWYRAFFTEAVLLEPPTKTGYLDERGERHVNPMLALSCYIARDNSRYGLARNMISPQDEINKRRSKLLHLLNVRQVVAERDTVREPQRFLDELAKPDGFAEVEPDALTQGRIRIDTGADLGQGQMALLGEAKAEIDNVGPNSSSLQGISDAASGRALLARQQAASQELEPVFAGFRHWRKRVYLAAWQRVRQFWTQEKWLRVTDDKELSGYRFVALNRDTTRAERFAEMLGKNVPLQQALDTAAGALALPIMMSVRQQHEAMMAAAAGNPRAQQAMASPEHLQQMIAAHPLMQQPVVAHQAAQMLVDITIDEAPETAVLEQEEFDALSKVAPAIIQAQPQMAKQMTEMLIRASSLRSKREILETMTKAPDPAAQQQAEQMRQLGQQMAMLQAALLQAQVGKTNADAQLSQARAQAEVLDAQIAAGKAPSEAQLTQAQAHGAMTSAALEATKVQAEAERDQATAVKHRIDAASRMAAATQPEIIAVPVAR